jgi:hypothetical protein
MPVEGASTPRRVTLPQLALLVPWVAVVLGSIRPITDNSYLWHVAAGRLQVDAGSVLTRDPFSFTMRGEPWLTQSWLADVGYAWLERVFGIGFTGWMVLFTAMITLGLAGAVIRRQATGWRVPLLLVATTVLLVPIMVPRPVIFTFPLLLLTALTWEQSRLRWALPFVFWLWASLHGSFFLGWAYIGLRWLAKREWPAYPFLIASVVPTLLTAHGLGVIRIVIDFATARSHLAHVTEWATPDLLHPTLAPFLLGMVLLMYGGIKGRIVTSDLWMIVPFLVLGLSATRAVFPSWLALLPLIAMSMGRGEERGWGRGFPLPVGVGVTLLIIGLPFAFAKPVQLDEERFPVEASAHLDPTLRTFHDDVAGGYLIYIGLLEPGVFIDDRVELYRERIDEFVLDRSGARGWHKTFEADGLEQALVTLSGPLRELLELRGWVVYYENHRYGVLRAD